MVYYKLKRGVGGHRIKPVKDGSGKILQQARSIKPDDNEIIQSKFNLARWAPEKFERVEHLPKGKKPILSSASSIVEEPTVRPEETEPVSFETTSPQKEAVQSAAEKGAEELNETKRPEGTKHPSSHLPSDADSDGDTDPLSLEEEAEARGLTVEKKGQWHYLYDDEGEKLNDKGLTEEGALDFLLSMDSE